MRKMKEVDIFIRDYFNGKLSQEQAQSFRDQYDNDADFKQLADQIEVEILGIRSHGRDQLKSKFQSWDEGASSEQAKQPFPFFKMGIAASTIIAIIFFGKSFLTPNSEELFLAYYEPYENFEHTPTRNESDEALSAKYKAYLEYDAANYADAERFFDELIASDSQDVAAVFFRGICRIETLAYDQALKDLTLVAESNHAYYSDAALWYLALLEIKLHQGPKAMRYLQKLKSSKDYQIRSQKLLDKLN